MSLRVYQVARRIERVPNVYGMDIICCFVALQKKEKRSASRPPTHARTHTHEHDLSADVFLWAGAASWGLNQQADRPF